MGGFISDIGDFFSSPSSILKAVINPFAAAGSFAAEQVGLGGTISRAANPIGEATAIGARKAGIDLGDATGKPIGTPRQLKAAAPPTTVDPAVLAARRQALARQRRLSQGRATSEAQLSLLSEGGGSGAKAALLGA